MQPAIHCGSKHWENEWITFYLKYSNRIKMRGRTIAFSTLKRCFSVQKEIKPKICIVGSGPAGFYSAQHLLKKLNNPEIDIYERLPVPFGLVRFGVAPDHPEVKNVINTFTKVAENQNVRFIGNVNLGRDVSLKELKQAYHVVLLTYGAEESRNLNIPGEDLPNVIPARKIVGWYNGIPWDKDLNIDLNNENVTIFGQGNVAIDVARILLSPIEDLRKTDITQHALEALSTSKVRNVYLVGRRGPLQAAFTIKELREMLKLKECTTRWQSRDFKGVADYVPKLARPKKRITELMLQSVASAKDDTISRTFQPIFCRSPLQIANDKIVLGVNELVGEDFLKQSAKLTEQSEEIQGGLVVTSIGYKSIQADSEIPFDDVKGLVKNVNSRVEEGVYVCGWLATGPTGVILTTMSNAFGTADVILHDIAEGKLVSEVKDGFEEVNRKLQRNNVQVVSWRDWLKIDEFERSEGEKVGKPREKIVDVGKMLEVAA